MSRLTRLKNTIKCLEKLYESGEIQAQFQPLRLTEDIADIKSFLNLMKKINDTVLSTLGSPQRSKKQTLNVRLNTLPKSSPIIKLLRTSDLESILNEKVCKPFWTKYSAEASRKLWLPARIDYYDLDMPYSNLYALDLIPPSKSVKNRNIKLHKKNLPKTLCPSLPFSPPDTTDYAHISYSRKVPLKITKKQKEFLTKCFGGVRYIYNKGVEHLHSTKRLPNRFALRKAIIGRFRDLPSHKAWLKEIPFDSQELILKNLLTNCKSGLTNYKRGYHRKFSLPKFKTKKDNRQILPLNDKALQNGRLCPKKLGVHSRLRFPKPYRQYRRVSLERDGFILKEGKRYYLIISYNRSAPYQPAENVVSLDPGLRNFQTFYSPQGKFGTIGEGFLEEIKKILHRIDLKNKVLEQVENRRTKQNLKRRVAWLITKVRRKIEDLHWQTCAFLVKNFRVILLPEFRVSQMVPKDRNPCKALRKDLLTLNHGAFRERMKFKCQEYQRQLILTQEPYTSKTCGLCGKINHNLGKDPVFTCPCGLETDRDLNGARNILIRYLTRKESHRRFGIPCRP